MKDLSHLGELLKGATKVVIIGIGYDMGKDDAVGIEVAELLTDKDPRIVSYCTYTAPENFTGPMVRHDPSHLIFVDGAKMGLEPGEKRIIDIDEVVDTSFSTHTLPVTVIANYVIQKCGAKVIIIGIEPKEFGFSDTKGLSPVVKEAAKDVADLILKAVCH